MIHKYFFPKRVKCKDLIEELRQEFAQNNNAKPFKVFSKSVRIQKSPVRVRGKKAKSTKKRS